MPTAPQYGGMTANETRNVTVSYVNRLESGELLTGTPTVTVSPTGPTITGIEVNDASVVVGTRTVLAGQAVQFTITDLTSGTPYTFTVLADTTGGQTLEGQLLIDCT